MLWTALLQVTLSSSTPTVHCQLFPLPNSWLTLRNIPYTLLSNAQLRSCKLLLHAQLFLHCFKPSFFFLRLFFFFLILPSIHLNNPRQTLAFCLHVWLHETWPLPTFSDNCALTQASDTARSRLLFPASSLFRSLSLCLVSPFYCCFFY